MLDAFNQHNISTSKETINQGDAFEEYLQYPFSKIAPSGNNTTHNTEIKHKLQYRDSFGPPKQMTKYILFLYKINKISFSLDEKDESNKLILGVIDPLSPPELLSQLRNNSNQKNYDYGIIKLNDFGNEKIRSKSPADSSIMKSDPSRSAEKKHECIFFLVSFRSK